MSSKHLRKAVLLALVFAFVVAPAAMACAAGGQGCCCSKANSGNCHIPAEREAPRARCCDTPAAPTPVTAAPGPTESLPLATAAETAVVTADRLPDDRAAISEIRGPDPPSVALYTLHATFLI